MDIAVSTNIYFERRYEPYIRLKECIDLCAKAGYKKLDFGFTELALVSQNFSSESWKEEILDYKKFAENKEVTFVQAHSTIFDFCNINMGYKEQEVLFRRSIEGAKILGVSWIVVHPSTGIINGKLDPDTHKKNIEFFRKYSDYALEKGVGLAIENMWGTTIEGIPRYCTQAEEMLRLIEDVNRKNIKVCWDVEHGSIENIDQKEAIYMLREHIVALHISDETGRNNIHILPYTGVMNWEEIIDALASINYSGVLSFEIQHYLPGMPTELILPAMRFSVKVGEHMSRRLKFMKNEYGYK